VWVSNSLSEAGNVSQNLPKRKRVSSSQTVSLKRLSFNVGLFRAWRHQSEHEKESAGKDWVYGNVNTNRYQPGLYIFSLCHSLNRSTKCQLEECQSQFYPCQAYQSLTLLLWNLSELTKINLVATAVRFNGCEKQTNYLSKLRKHYYVPNIF
jgi:hypothetical protein